MTFHFWILKRSAVNLFRSEDSFRLWLPHNGIKFDRTEGYYRDWVKFHSQPRWLDIFSILVLLSKWCSHYEDEANLFLASVFFSETCFKSWFSPEEFWRLLLLSCTRTLFRYNDGRLTISHLSFLSSNSN